MHRIVCVLFLCLLPCFGQIFSQSPITIKPPDNTPLTRSFTTDDGLPQNTPTAMVQTRDGYIWIATFGGLARFDGLKFTVFTTTEFPGLTSSRLTALTEDRNGVLWIGSEEGDLVRYKDGHFTLVWKSAGPPLDGVIWSIYSDENNLLWLATDSGLKTYDQELNLITRLAGDLIIPGIPQNSPNVNSFATDGSGVLWMSTGRGLIRYADGRFTNFPTIGDTEFRRLASNPFGPIFVFLTEGLFTFDGEKLEPIKISKTLRFPAAERSPADFVYWDGVYRPTSGGVEFFPVELGVKESDIRSTFVDREGNLWAGTNFDLRRFTRRSIAPFSFIEDNQVQPTTCMIGTPDGSVYVCGRTHIIRFKDGISSVAMYFNGKMPFSVAYDDQTGSLWGTTKDNIFQDIGGVLTPLDHPSLEGASDFRVIFDRSGALWIGTTLKGVISYKGGDTQVFSKESGLPDNAITRVFEDSKGIIWVGTKHGFSRIENGKVVLAENDLKDMYVRDFHEDVDGNMWIGTYGGGLARIRDGKLAMINEGNGLAENIVSRILADDNDNLWILGNRGVFSVSRKALNDLAEGRSKRVYCSVFGKQDGMEVTEGNGIHYPSGWKAQDGKLWFPMIQGGIVVDPSRMPISPPVFIESVVLDGQRELAQAELRVPDGGKPLEIDYTGVTFVRPEHLQFRYMLEGFDQAWQEAGTRRTAYYPNLPPGDYTFRVAAITGAGDLSPSTASIRVVVVGPFWRTKAFYAMLIVLALGLIFLAYQLRMRKVNRDKELEQEFARQLIDAHETERKRVAGEIHDGIGHGLLTIKNGLMQAIAKYDRRVAERKDLEAIVDMTSAALEETRTISSNLRPMHLRRFGLTSSLQNVILTIQQASLTKIVANIDNIDDLFSPEDELSIYRIVQESLNNIIKHSFAKNAIINIARNEKGIDITIEDDGVGFDTSIRQRAKLMGGKYTVKSLISKGTMAHITLPSRKVNADG